MTKKKYLTGNDLLNWLQRLDYDQLNKPIAVSEKKGRITTSYLNEDEIVYAVSIAVRFSKSKNFDGYLIEGMTEKEIEDYQVI